MPFVFHEIGHAVAAWRLGVPMAWEFRLPRLVWRIDPGTDAVYKRIISASGFTAEFVGALAFLDASQWATIAYAVVACSHFFWYATTPQGEFDDFVMFR